MGIENRENTNIECRATSEPEAFTAELDTAFRAEVPSFEQSERGYEQSAAPQSLRDATFSYIKLLATDETSGIVPAEVIENVAGDILGDRIAPGLYVAHTAKRARFHLLDVPGKDSFRDASANQNALLGSLRDNQVIEGVTPSMSAFRVFMLMFQSFPDVGPEDVKKLSALRREVRKIDLKNPEDLNWHRDVFVNLGGESVRASVNLVKNSLATRLISHIAGKDIPVDQRMNRYSLRMELSLAVPSKTKALTLVETAIKRINSTAYLVAPTIAASWIIGASGLSGMVTSIFSSPAARAASQLGVEFVAPFAIGLGVSMFVYRPLSKLRHR